MREKFKILIGVLTALSVFIVTLIHYVKIAIFVACVLIFLFSLRKFLYNIETIDISDIVFFLSCSSLLIFIIKFEVIVFAVIAFIFRLNYKRQVIMTEFFNY